MPIIEGGVDVYPGSLCGLIDHRRKPLMDSGFVTATMARLHSMGTMAHDDLACPPPVSARDHPARRLALSPFHPQPSRHEDLLAERGLDVSYKTVRRWVLKFGTIVRPGASPSTPAANVVLASRRDGGDDRGPAVLGSCRQSKFP
jgi:hypothetical protein